MPLLARACPALPTTPPLAASFSHARPRSLPLQSLSRRPLLNNPQKPSTHQFSRAFHSSPAAMAIKTYFDIQYADPSAPNTGEFTPLFCPVWHGKAAAINTIEAFCLSDGDDCACVLASHPCSIN